MKKKQEVILRFFRDGDSKSKISRDLQLHRQTVRAYIAEYLAELEKEKQRAHMLKVPWQRMLASPQSIKHVLPLKLH